jgi:tetratricopeptide (TPR) repeat protein
MASGGVMAPLRGEDRLPAASDAPDGQVPEAVRIASRKRLSRTFAMYASRAVRKDEPSLADLELSLILAEAATRLDPDNEAAWRLRQGVATLGASGDPEFESIRREATARLARLAPGDQVIRLQRLMDVINQSPTAEGRVTAFRTMLAPDNVAKLGRPIAARLSLELALLLQRTGDLAGFRAALAEAVNLDPSFPAAAVMAAGYFRATASPVEEAELLALAMMANPTDQLMVRAFAQLLLEHGAYRGAARFLAIAAEAIHVSRPAEIYDPLVAEVALALWADGRPREAMDLLLKRQRELDAFLREAVGEQDPAILGDAERLSRIRYPTLGLQAVIRTAIIREIGNADDLAKSLREAEASFQAAAETRGREEVKPETLQQLRIDSAFFWAAIAEDVEKAKDMLAKAGAELEVPEGDQARLDGWIALRSGDPAGADRILAPFVEVDPLSRYGRALALEALGRRREAAGEYRGVYESASSTLIGVLAGKRLAGMLGAPIPASPLAADMEGVAASIPPEFDALFDPNRSPVLLRCRVPEPLVDAFEPIPVTFEIVNNSRFPLAVSPGGPVRPMVAAQVLVSSAGRPTAAELPYQMLGIDRMLVLPPRSTHSVTVDLSATEVGEAISTFCATGSSTTMRCYLNWVATAGGMKSGMLGDRIDAPQLRADGVRMTPEWVGATIGRLRNPETAEDLANLAQLVAAAFRATQPNSGVKPEMVEALVPVWDLLTEVMPKLDTASQAWLLAVMPNTIAQMRPALDAVRESPDPLVRLAYLIRRSDRSGDPVVEAAIASDDPVIARYGRVVQLMLQREEEILRRDYNLSPSITP